MWKFKNANLALYREKLSDYIIYNWAKCFEGNDLDKISDNINKNILNASKHTISNRQVTICHTDKTSYSNELHQLKDKC